MQENYIEIKINPNILTQMPTHHKPYALSSIENHVGINRGRKKVTIIGLNPINLT